MLMNEARIVELPDSIFGESQKMLGFTKGLLRSLLTRPVKDGEDTGLVALLLSRKGFSGMMEAVSPKPYGLSDLSAEYLNIQRHLTLGLGFHCKGLQELGGGSVLIFMAE